MVCLTDLQETAVSPQVNTYPDCDRALLGSERYPASVKPSNSGFGTLE